MWVITNNFNYSSSCSKFDFKHQNDLKNRYFTSEYEIKNIVFVWLNKTLENRIFFKNILLLCDFYSYVNIKIYIQKNTLIGACRTMSVNW